MIVNNLDYDQAWRDAAKHKQITEALHFPTSNIVALLYDTIGGSSYLSSSYIKVMKKKLFEEQYLVNQLLEYLIQPMRGVSHFSMICFPRYQN